MGMNTLVEVSRFMKRLLSNLIKQKFLRIRFKERKVDIDRAFSDIAQNSLEIDENKVRDAFLKYGIYSNVADINRFLCELSKDGNTTITKQDLVAYLGL